ncbi:LexA family protein [Gracilibacillus dipsosauri]|uniref:LexA family protein n=1 Tax=Gracilibacillus dipsosauri TaxID=178340 RepID=UPI00240A0075
MNIGQRIKQRRKQLKLSVDEMAEKLGKNRATIYRYESSEIENMPLDILEPLAKVLKVTPAYLMGWESEKDLPTLSSNYPYLPTAISAGLPLNVEAIHSDDVERITIPDSVMGKWAGNKDIFILRVFGESMNRVIPDQSLIAVKSINPENLKNGDIVVYSDGNDYSVKRYYKHDNTIVFRPDSTDIRFTDYITSTDNSNLVIHGKVVVYVVELD